MNLCILQGTIISNIEFKFIIKGKNKSIAYFDMLLSNKSIIRIKSYDEKADFVYRKFKQGGRIIIEGKIRDNDYVELCRTIFLDK